MSTRTRSHCDYMNTRSPVKRQRAHATHSRQPKRWAAMYAFRDDWKCNKRKMWHDENIGGGKCWKRKCGIRLQEWKMRERKMPHNMQFGATFSTLSILCRIFFSRIFHPGNLVPHFPFLHFPPIIISGVNIHVTLPHYLVIWREDKFSILDIGLTTHVARMFIKASVAER